MESPYGFLENDPSPTAQQPGFVDFCSLPTRVETAGQAQHGLLVLDGLVGVPSRVDIGCSLGTEEYTWVYPPHDNIV